MVRPERFETQSRQVRGLQAALSVRFLIVDIYIVLFRWYSRSKSKAVVRNSTFYIPSQFYAGEGRGADLT